MFVEKIKEAPAVAGRALPSNQRRAFLEVLHQVIKETQPGVNSTLVLRAGCQVLFVFDAIDSSRCGEVGCDFDRVSGWAFTWIADGSILGRVQDVHPVAAMLRARTSGRGPR
ncbi:hypothetical protein DZF91_16895 [Actinomadura logoneensis]|uniref:Uncharacterized protein n=1 Tax=Actinomadura logoneensis TaxID=2293572 RepID=A0A372JKG9_9ACTN|nr:hypothetical protein [Actinomadura logoneensis]RFU40495.1 hypothetical protein DZF91_16895 [Actinomadura logoneensis]